MADEIQDSDLDNPLPSGQRGSSTPVPTPPAPSKAPDASNLQPVIDEETGAALDKLVAQKTNDAPAEPEEVEPEKPAKVEKKDEPAPAPEPEKKDDPAPEPEKKDEPAPEPEPEDELSKVKLSPHARPATAEAFATVKTMARQQIKAQEEKIAALTQQIEEAKKGDSTKLEALQKENAELKAWQARVDVENDPSFKEYDTKITKNVDLIYAKLKTAGLTEEHLKEVREVGLDKLNWSELSKYVPEPIIRYCEAKLLENETLLDTKREAQASAKENASKFVQERAQKAETAKKEFATNLENTVKSYLSGKDFSWAVKQQVPAGATPEQKAAIEAANSFAEESQARIKDLMGDDSPDSRAQMIVGTALAFKFQADLAAAKKSLEAEKATSKKLQEQLDRIKKSSGATSTPSSAPQRPSKAAPVLFGDTESALDALRAQLSPAD